MLLKGALNNGLDIKEWILIGIYAWFGYLGFHCICRADYYNKMASYVTSRPALDNFSKIWGNASKYAKESSKFPADLDARFRKSFEDVPEGCWRLRFWRFVCIGTVISMILALFVVMML